MRQNGPMTLENENVWSEAARQVARAVRGRRSQLAFSRRLGFRSNVAADWEGGHRAPTAALLLRGMERVGIDVAAGFHAFHAEAAPHLEEGLPAWLRALRGQARQQHLAQRAGCSRHQIRRWLSGEAEPRLPDFLRLVHALTGRAPDWVAALVDIEQVPALAGAHRVARTAARLAYDHPWAAAVRMLVNTEAYRADPTDAFLAEALGLPHEALREAVEALQAAGLVRRHRGSLQPVSSFTAEATASPEDRRRLKAHWAKVATDRLHHPRADDLVSLNLITLSRADLKRVHDLQRAYFRELRSLVAASAPEEVAALVMMHTVSLSPSADP